jgi:2-desacetyl-2-hydroxyethyl bacteriochlorophyllide A dehydrogenase
MKAIFYTEYGTPDVLHLKEMEKPVPKDNEILVRVHAASVNYGDVLARKFAKISPTRDFNMPLIFFLPARMEFGFTKPKKNILGNEFAGEVEAAGGNVTSFKKGDAVFGYRGPAMGTHAEYVCVPEDGSVALKPSNMTYEEAAAIPYGALTALNLLRKMDIQSGQKVLINGASGGIGSAAVQLARYYGAEVTGVCGTPRMDFVRSLGANHVIDYMKEDFTRNGKTYDVIFDVLGRSSFSKCRNSLNENGRYVLASFKVKQLLQMLWTSRFSTRKVICALSMEPGDLNFIRELVETGRMKSVIDRRFTLAQTADAHRYMESGHRKSSVVITMQ